MKLFKIIKKNLKLLLQYKWAALGVMLGPLLLIVFAGLAFNTSSFQNVTVGVHANSYDSVLNYFIDNVKKHFNVEKFDSIEECNERLKFDKVNLCIDYDDSSKEVLFYVNPSRMNLVYSLLNIMSRQMQYATKDLSYNLTSSFINDIANIDSLIENKRSGLNDLVLKSKDLKKKIEYNKNLLSSSKLDISSPNFDIGSFRRDLDSFYSQNLEFNKMVNENIDLTLNDIYSYEILLSQSEAELLRKKQEKERVTSQLDEEFYNNNCNSYHYLDLSQYYSNPDYIVSILNTSEKPVCSIIYTAKNNEDVCTGDLDKAYSDVQNMKSKLQDTKSKLYSFKSSSNNLFEENRKTINSAEKKLDSVSVEMSKTNNKISEFNMFKKNIKSDLESMEFAVDYNIIFLSKFNDSLNNITSKFKKMSAIKAENLVDPIKNRIVGFDKNKKVIDYFFPVILLFIIMFVGIILGDILIVREKKSPAMFRNLISPTNYDVILLGNFLTVFFIIFLQSLFIILFSFLFLHLSVNISFFSFVFVLLSSIILFSSIGIIIGNLSNSESSSVVISVLISLGLLIFSNAIQPVETMPVWIAFFVKLNPFYILSQLLSESFIFGISIFNDSRIYLLLLYLFLAVIFLKVTTNKSNGIIKRS